MILYTTASNVDLNTGEAFALAKTADPKSERTLVVVTKIDLRSQEFMSQFREMCNTKLGVVCVRNRTSDEVKKRVLFDEVKQLERLQFSSPDLAELPQSSRGVDQLVFQLVQLQK